MKLLNSSYALAAGLVLLLTGCSEYTPNGYTEVPELAAVSSINYTVGGAANHDINITWALPADKDVRKGKNSHLSDNPVLILNIQFQN